MSGFTPQWLRLREPADAAARATELLDPVRDRLAGRSPLVISDLGCGTGSMGRWLAPRLPGPQHWILYDRDPALLHQAAGTMPGTAADGSPVTVETRTADVTRLTAADLAGSSLVTASALLDILTRDEVGALAAACVGAACPALLTLSVIGQVELTPADPSDAEITEAFNAHQRRDTDGRRLLGPDAVDAAAEAFTRLGASVLVRPSPWRLGPRRAHLTGEWLQGWVRAAWGRQPDFRDRAPAYVERRLRALMAGELSVVVHHSDLLANCG